MKMEVNIQWHEVVLLTVYAPTDGLNDEIKNNFLREIIDIWRFECKTDARKEAKQLGDMD